MITTNTKVKGACNGCDIERIFLAALDGGRHVDGTPTGLCNGCFNRAGDDNAVSDGNMTCAEFRANWGAHSTYCTCAAVAVGVPAADTWTVTLTTVQINRLFAAMLAGRTTDRLSDDDLTLMLALNGAAPIK